MVSSKEELVHIDTHRNRFEQFRNSTSFYMFIDKWNQEMKSDYYKNKGVQRVLTFYQFQLAKYMGGYKMKQIASEMKYQQFLFKSSSDDINPRGNLSFWSPGTGKSMGFLSAALFSVTTRKDIYKEDSQIVLIMNKALQQKTIKDIEKYIQMLNQNKIGLDLQESKQKIMIDQVMKQIKLVTFNDTTNFSDNINDLFEVFNMFQTKFIVFDEAQNLFRSILQQSKRGMQIFDHFMRDESIQLILASGTPISNDPRELSVCFQLLTRNPQIMSNQNFDDLFIHGQGLISKKPSAKNKEIFLKRIAGLVQFVEFDISSIDENSSFPQLLPLVIKQLKFEPEQEASYIEEKKKERKKDAFMQKSRMASDGVIKRISKKVVIISVKFQAIKQHIENHPKQLHIVYSNFVENGCILFQEYCKMYPSSFEWQQYSDKTTVLSDRKDPNRIVFAAAHGQTHPEQRQQLIDVFNSPENSNGSIINVLVLSPASTEGINTHNVRFVHVVEPQWTQTIFEQVIFRAVRKFSHASLPVSERIVQPILYIGYDSIPFDLDLITKRDPQMSTDQVVYYKSIKKSHLSIQFMLLLELAAFNCCDFKDLNIKKIHKMLSLQVGSGNGCFRCGPNYKQLFTPNNIYKDLQLETCIRSNVNMQSETVKFKNIDYVWTIDIYSQYGINIHEKRDITRTLIREDTDLFADLYRLISTSLLNKISTSLLQEQVLDKQNEDIQSVLKVKPQVVVNFVDEFKDKALHLETNKLLSIIRPINIQVQFTELDVSQQVGGYHSISILKIVDVFQFKETLNDIIINIQTEINQRGATYGLPLPFKHFSEIVERETVGRSVIINTTNTEHEAKHNPKHTIKHDIKQLTKQLLYNESFLKGTFAIKGKRMTGSRLLYEILIPIYVRKIQDLSVIKKLYSMLVNNTLTIITDDSSQTLEKYIMKQGLEQVLNQYEQSTGV